MSTFQAIATVTATLRQRLLEVAQADVPGSAVTALRPAEPGGGGIPSLGVNLFLFAAHVNPAHRNRELPLRRAGGEAVSRPMVPLDLDYLISFYGEQNGGAQLLLGSVMRDLHAAPVLTNAMITAAEGASGLASGLADQAERVRLTPLPLPLEEMAKLWSVFFQTSYALSVAYRAGPVLLEAELPTVAAPPVTLPQLTTAPLLRPAVTTVENAADPAAPIAPGSQIAVVGERLAGPAVRAEVGGVEVAPDAVAERRLLLTLPPGLPAGPVGLRVRQDVLVGDPPSPRRGEASRLVPFVLHPAVARPGGAFAVAVTEVSGTGAAPRNATVTVGLVPPLAPGQRASLELLEASGAVRHVFPAPLRAEAAGSVAFAVRGVVAGTYGLRVRVEGAETPLGEDAAGEPEPRLVLP
ncbi:DUF4255 domain-containing protein [Roseomonas populi]|uniref:DUF4255 domain-containing protein n=1 Tax=Roseomonas populi TaxID=3121582 RepID=A0ABT1X3S2_9PROT|nr:DUF4255 domain-containing protein [Roseomonas pecuniae]MCR0982751.1 DUF4255 domain-containing protein [Roseomonas pecuniae]